MQVSGLWAGALSRSLCASSQIEGTYLGAHSELNPRTICTIKRFNINFTLHGRVFQSSIFIISLPHSLSPFLSLYLSSLALSLTIYLSMYVSLVAGSLLSPWNAVPYCQTAELGSCSGCAWNGCNARATMRCPWCHQITYCNLGHRNLTFALHGVDCRARSMCR